MDKISFKILYIKVKFVSFIFALISLQEQKGFSQVAGDYRTNATGAQNWSNVAIWQRYDGSSWVPASDYPGQNPGALTVTIQDNITLTLNITPANAIQNLIIATSANSSSLSLGTNTLTVSGNVSINQITNNTAKYIRIQSGTLNCTNLSMTSTGGTDARDAYVEITDGTLNVSGNITMNSTGLRTYIRFTGGAANVNVGGNITGGYLTSTAGGSTTAGPTSGTVNYNGSGAQTINAYKFWNLTISNDHGANNVTLVSVNTIGIANAFSPIATFTSGGYVITNNTIDFNGTGPQTIPAFSYFNLTISSVRTTNSVTFSNSGTVGIAGALTLSATFTSGGYVTTGSTVDYNGTAAQTIVPIPAVGYWHLTASGTGTKTLSDNITINRNFSISGTATVYTNTFQITGNAAGTMTMGDGTTLNLGNTINATNVLFPTNYTAGNIYLHSNSSVVYQSNGAQTVSPVPQYGNLTLATSNTKTCNGSLTVNATLGIKAGVTFSAGTAASTWNLNGDVNIAGILDFGTTTAKTMNVFGNLYDATGTITMTGLGLAHQLNLYGASNAITTLNTTAGSNSTVTYARAGDQQVIASPNYQNLAVSGGGSKTLIGNVTVNGTLNLTNGLLQLGNYNLNVISSAATAIQGSFGNSSYIDINGNGYLQKGVSASTSYTLPIGSNGIYAPVTAENITGSTFLRLRTIFSTTLGSQYLKRYWQVTGSGATTATLTFKYDATENPVDPSKIWVRPTAGAWAIPSGIQSFDDIAKTFTIAGTTNISATTTEWTAGYPPKTFFSYQTGNWNDPATWTDDPGGTTYNNIGTPTSDGDIVVILSGRTVTLTADVTTTNLEVNINEGGILNMSTYRFTNTLKELNGQGTLKLASVNFPAATTNTFVNSGGGITEYNNTANFTLPVAQTTYNTLRINAPGVTATQLNNLTLNGDLHVMQGTYRINDNTAARRQLTIMGNVTVESGASITVGNGVTNTTTNPTAVAEGGTAPFTNYYETQSHRVVVYGDFTNHGTVRFTNLDYPVYNLLPPITLGTTSGYATVYFRGASSNLLYCNGITDFYNLVLDKGVDQTYSLTVYSTDYKNFRLFGANIAGGYGGTANPNLDKALWIRTGTLILEGTTIIPSLSEGNCDVGTGGPNSDFYVPGNGALVLDGDNVVILTTADDYREVNVAYGVSGPSNAAMGINASAGCSSFSIYGLLKVNKGYISTRESGGFIQWALASGQFEVNGGIIDAKQYRTAGSAGGLASYSQSGGTFHLRGRFRRTPSAYTSVNDLVAAPLNTNRSTGGLNGDLGTFNLNETANVFNMSGGTIYIYDVCGDGTTPTRQKAFEVKCDPTNVDVTGGSIVFQPYTGSGAADSPNFRVISTAQFGNFTVNRQSSSSVVMLDTYPLTVLSNFSILSGDFNANNLNVTIGGNMFVANGTNYTTGTNWTIFNGDVNQTITSNTTTPLVFKKFRMDKLAGKILNFAGTQTDFHVQDSLMLISGTLNDGGKTISLIPSTTTTKSYIYNSALHLGSGKIVISDDDPTDIDGDGNGIFKNLELNNTDALVAPVRLKANITISGTLTFSQDKLLDISSYNIRFTSTASLIGVSSNRYITSAGQAGNGGVTRTFASGLTSFTFPVGAPSTMHAAPAFTPATISISGTPTAWGDITVVPVGYEHPATTTKNRSLTYYWRVKTSGMTLGSATATIGFTYDQADIVTGIGITEDGYVAARFDISTATWTRGNTNDVDESTNTIGEPGTGNFLENVYFLDGDYTAGDDNPTNPFGTPTVYYSRQNGLWGNTATWSTVSHTGPPATAVPGAGDIAIIGGADSVYLNTNLTTPNTDVRSCAILKIEAGSALDIGFNPGCNFALVLNHPNGNGNFRLTTNYNSNSTYQFPSGDFSDYNVNLGTTEMYTTNPIAGTTYYLPNGITSYGNLILSPLGGSNVIFPNNDLLIYGNLITRGQNADSWFCPTWNVNYPTAPVVRIPKTITVNGNLDIQGGALVWYGNGTIAQSIVVKGNVLVNSASAIDNWDASTARMSIGGNLVNNTTGASGGGIFTPRECDFRNIPLTFFGSNTSSVTNTMNNPVTRFGTVIIDKGSTQADSLIIRIGGTLQTPTDNWLTLRNGTLVYRRDNPNSDFTISTATPFIIPETAGLYIDYPNNSGNRNILIANSNVNTNDITLAGKLTIKAGRVFVGPINGTTNNNNDIVYTGDGNSTIVINGGQLFVNGQIRRSTSTTTGVLKYYQTGGEVIINGQGADATALTRAKLEVANPGSVFSMSGGTITIVRGGGTTFGDLYIRPASGSVTGGTIAFTQTPASWATADAVQNYRMDANIALNNIVVTGKTVATARTATLNLMVNPLVLNGSLTLTNNQSFFTANNINVTLKGNFTNNGTYTPGTNVTTFNGGVQQILGTTSTTFNSLVINPITSVTLASNSITVNGNLTLTSGTFACGSYQVNLKGNLANNATYTDNGTGTGILLNGTNLQYISGNGTFSTLELNNLNGSRLQNSITLTKDLLLTQGIFNINQYMLTLGVNSSLLGSPFSAAKMIEVDGVFSNVGVRKYFNSYSGAAQTFTYPIGVSGKYTPVILTYTDNTTTGYIRVNAINSNHPGVLDPTRVLKYYWEVENNAVAGVNGSLVFNYKDADVRGNEPDYIAARTVGGSSWSKAAPGPATDNVDEANNTITFYLVNANDLNGEFTAGEDPAIPNNIPQFTSTKDGNWNDPSVWVQTGGDPYTLTGGPNGFIVTISPQDSVTINQNQAFTYRTTINGTLRSVQPYYGHNIGIVSGQGTLYVDGGPFPAGRYDSFMDCSTGGTLEYGGSTNYNVVADLYSSVRRLRFTGTGSRYLPAKNLTICEQLLINGPIVDNSANNRKLTILGTMERYGTGSFIAGTGANATVEFAGSSAQIVGGPLGDFSGSNKFNNLVINNSNGLSIGTNGTIEVGGNLYLTNGIIHISATNRMKIVNTAINCVIPAAGSSTSFVDGPLTKNILSSDSFRFPIGKGTTLGSKLSVISPEAYTPGVLEWTAEFFTPNPSYNSYAAPLTYVNSMEYWNISVPSGGSAYIALDWDPASDLTPLMTQNGLSDMRVAYDNAGVWTERTSTATGDNNYGTVTTTSRVTIPISGSESVTTACINTTKPRARLNPSGPVCGDAGIPVAFIGTVRPFNYILEYTKDGIPQTPITVTAEPYVLPTDATGATYQLTSFTYNSPSSPTAGVIDPTPVTTYTVPTTADAGLDQSLCGATQATLAANTPTVGSGQWSIVSGLGGTVVQPTLPNSLFNGINGNSYVLRWTITNGGCTSTDDVNISFPLLPETPADFVLFDDNVCQGDINVGYSVANNPTLTYTWSYSGTGATINGSGNAISIDYGPAATSGNVSVYTTNGCGNSAPLSRAVTVNQRPTATIAITGSSSICDSDQTELTITFAGGTSPYSFDLTDGTNTYSLNSNNPNYVYSTGSLTWLGPNPSRVITYSIPVVTSANGCSNTGSNTVDVNVYKIPETGPQYHVPNSFAF